MSYCISIIYSLYLFLSFILSLQILDALERFFPLSTGEPPIPELDLGFAIAAGSMDATETFQLMKDTIAAIISEYQLDKINYGLIVFGDAAIIQIEFGEYSNVNNLLRVLRFTPKKRSGASLVDALREADSLFSSSDVRLLAKKVLVVITDLASGESSSQVEEAARPLQDKGVKIVAVAIGKEADPIELETFTPVDKIIEEEKTVQPTDLKKTIMEKVLTGWFAANITLVMSLKLKICLVKIVIGRIAALRRKPRIHGLECG